MTTTNLRLAEIEEEQAIIKRQITVLVGRCNKLEAQKKPRLVADGIGAIQDGLFGTSSNQSEANFLTVVSTCDITRAPSKVAALQSKAG